MSNTPNHISKNAMELLVYEEINRQFEHLPKNLTKYINRIEVATYALNQLPPLYASSEEGLNRQKAKGKLEHNRHITKAVRQGFAAVQRDLLRHSTPLILNDDKELIDARNALKELTNFLPHREFSWQQLVGLIKPLLLSNKKEPLAEADNSSWDSSWADCRYTR